MDLAKRHSKLIIKTLKATPEFDERLAIAVNVIYEQIQQIEKALVDHENRHIQRVLYKLPKTRRMLNSSVLYAIAVANYPEGALRENFLKMLPAADTDEPLVLVKQHANQQPSPEVDVYLHLLLLLKIIDVPYWLRAETIAEMLMEKTANRNHTMDPISAKVFYYYSLAAEHNNKFKTIRGTLLERLRTATLRNDFESVAVLLNCLLRNYIYYSLYDQAEKLVKKMTLHESASNNEWARYYYYLARIQVVKLEYSAAQKSLANALRKAPQKTPLGFLQAVQKLIVVVELLLGNIPERKLFYQPNLRRSLAPYLYVTCAVRLGDVKGFNEVIDKYADRFQKDCTYTLILRVRHNVIKTALRTMASAYSCIPLETVAKTLFLESAEEAEYVVSKAIHDGVIEARLDAEHGCMCTKDPSDIYSTSEPLYAFNERIAFCLGLRNQSVKSMRYQPKNTFEEEEAAKEKRERAREEEEMAMELDDDDFDDF